METTTKEMQDEFLRKKEVTRCPDGGYSSSSSVLTEQNIILNHQEKKIEIECVLCKKVFREPYADDYSKGCKGKIKYCIRCRSNTEYISFKNGKGNENFIKNFHRFDYLKDKYSFLLSEIDKTNATEISIKEIKELLQLKEMPSYRNKLNKIIRIRG